MKTTIAILSFFIISFGSAQEEKISKSDIIGYWQVDLSHPKNSKDIVIYKRCFANTKGTVVQFKSNGYYKYIENWEYRRSIRGPRRCGNEKRLSINKDGTYSVDGLTNEIRLKSYEVAHRTTWNVVCLDKQTLAITYEKYP